MATRWVSPIRFTNRMTASTSPASTATVRSAKMVSRKVMNITRESPVLSFSSLRNCLRSLIFQATTIRIGAIAASGMLEA
ncbi:hypothetical protein D3C86_2074740 [compost metagenome]